MGQTLTHGIYLPDEGERNCYAGLAANWQLLDGAVGTIAEHTTALSGKAPLVHTHVKADITDFPVYGTTAGTICEGNDSRLSDARTPVAHTHGKADITDLFNSANTWTGDNSFSKTLNIYNSDSAGTTPALYLKSSKSVIGTTSGSETDIQKIAVLDKNGNTVSENTTYVYSAGSSWVVNAVYTTDGSDNVISSQISHYIYKNGRRVLRPDTDTDLGTSANQWNNLYAKNYYYNGVAWGLDKSNTWSQINDFKTLRLYGVASNNLVMYPPSGEKGDSSTFGFNVICSDKNLGTYQASGVANIGMGQSGGTSYVALNASTKGSIDNNIHSIQIGLQIAASDNANIGSFYPTQNGGINLGTSTSKWKTLNGVNPGALSLPDMGTTADVNYFDFTSTITPLDGTDIFYRPPVDGWMTIIIAGTALALFEDASSSKPHVQGSGVTAAPVKGYCEATIPVHKNTRVKINAIGTSVYMAQVRPCLGNV